MQELPIFGLGKLQRRSVLARLTLSTWYVVGQRNLIGYLPKLARLCEGLAHVMRKGVANGDVRAFADQNIATRNGELGA